MRKLLNWLSKKRIKRGLQILRQEYEEDCYIYVLLAEGAQEIEKQAFREGEVIQKIQITPTEDDGYDIWVRKKEPIMGKGYEVS